MPEIPDLNIFIKNLAAKLVGKKLISFEIPITRRLKSPVEDFKSAFEGQALTAVDRSGKEIHFTFKNGNKLALHLMLHGEMHWYTGINENRFTIAELLFDDGTGLSIVDWQKAVILTIDPPETKVPDALDIPSGYLVKALAKMTKSIKTALTEGKVLRGIGNAYVDEILYEAKISPLSIANKIPAREVVVLEKSIETVLTNAENHINTNHPDTITEKERDFLQVHRPKETLTLKGEPILKTDIDKRKTYYTDGQTLHE